MPKGTVDTFSPRKGYGFIVPNDDPENHVFFHYTTVRALSKTGLVGFYQGQPVEFELDPASAKPRALHVNNADPSRRAGVVKEYDGRDEGRIELDDGSDVIPFSGKDVHDAIQRRVTFRPGEPVELSVAPREPLRIIQLDTRPPLLRFASEASLTMAKLEVLAQMAPEDWDYPNRPTGNLPILQFYILNTFARLEQQDKILYDEDTDDKSNRACFNTGLVTELQEEILAVFDRSSWHGKTPREPKWRLIGFFQASDKVLSSFAQTEFPLATYFTEVTQLFLDPHKRLNMRVGHIVGDNIDRFPSSLQNEQAARGALERAWQDAKRRTQRNYKAAVPQFYRGQVQLLLPLALEDPRVVDRALVLEQTDKSYTAFTIFYMDWAYRNARLLARPDKDWLKPVKQSGLTDDDDTFESDIQDSASNEEGKELMQGRPTTLRVGDIVEGQVTGVTHYGAFVEVGPGRQGLCHVSELVDPGNKATPFDVIQKGEVIKVKVIELTPKGPRLTRRGV